MTLGSNGKATATRRLFCEETCVYLRYIPIRSKSVIIYLIKVLLFI